MKKLIKQRISQLTVALEPKLKQAKDRWLQLLPRERLLVMALGVFAVISLFYLMVTNLISYKNSLQRDVNDLRQFTLYSTQVSQSFKQISKINENQVSTPNTDQIRSDIKQVLNIDNPNIISQDGQISINIPNVEFNLVMTLLDQFRRSYGMFPDQINITRQPQSGFVSFNATFWINQ